MASRVGAVPPGLKALPGTLGRLSLGRSMPNSSSSEVAPPGLGLGIRVTVGGGGLVPGGDTAVGVVAVALDGVVTAEGDVIGVGRPHNAVKLSVEPPDVSTKHRGSLMAGLETRGNCSVAMDCPNTGFTR